MIKKLKFLSIVLLAMCSSVLMAQVTTSSMSGKITSKGELVLGATVVVKHQPSGTTYKTITNNEGRFNINGMRVGGPYVAKISYIGLKTIELDGISLQLGETFPLNVEMSENEQALNEVVVLGKKTKFRTEKTGASTNISSSDMANMPSISRSLTDVTRLSPFSSGMSFAGSDGRSTNFTVDGANFNNNFGLSSRLPGGGTPISMDAIEEIQVVVSPFDVRQTNFIGGGINAITKSGTNKFKATAYTYFHNQDMRGNKVDGKELGERKAESRKVFGATLGGPIVKNKLFFFVNAEMEKRPGQVVQWKASESGVSDNQTTSRAKISDMEKVKKHLMDRYGYDTGSYTDFPGDESNVKLLARLDWNINDANKLNIRYNYTKNQAWRPTNGNSTDAGYRNRGMNRISQYGMAFSNSLYSMDNIVNSLSAELNSRINDNMSNQLLATYSKIDDVRGSNSSPFPFIDILKGRDSKGNPIIEPYISAGYELFTWNNGVHNDVFTLTDNFTYYLDQHKITAGASFEYQMANNAYMRNGTGYYRYASLDDFLNEKAPIDFALTYGYNGEKNPNAEVRFNQYGLYIQDEWNVNDKLKLTYGVRADFIDFADNLIRNNAIYEKDFGGKHIDTGVWPNTNVLFSPRVGFTYDVLGDNSLKVRGGTGIFTGRLPLVFFTNMPTNAGMVQNRYAARTGYNKDGSIKYSDSKILNQLSGKMITNVDEMIKKLGLPNDISPDKGVLPYEIAGVDPNFKMPQVWKTSLAVDYQVPTSFPLSVTVEGIYTKTLNGVMLKDWNRKDVTDKWTRYEGSDNRYIYPNDFTYGKQAAFVLSNTNEGWGLVGNVTVNAEPIKNLRLMAAYTYTEAMEISGMPGSNARSAYSGLRSVNGPHIPNLERSQYVVPHKVIASAAYKLPWEGNRFGTSTLINLFYTGRNPYSYSYYYVNDMNGDGIGTDLIYIPKGKGDIKFKTVEDENAFFAYMEQDKYLSANKGKYAGANKLLAPWLNELDLRIAQEFLVKAGKTNNRLQVSLDISNIGNLINSSWGIPQNLYKSNNGKILKYEGTKNNQPIYSFAKIKNAEGKMVYPTSTFSPAHSIYDTWSIQIGVKYLFN